MPLFLYLIDGRAMGTITGFEDLIAWQKSRVLARKIYASTRNPIFSKDFGLSNQIQRAATSIMSNIAEVLNERVGLNSFISYHSPASWCRSKSQLYLAFDIGYLSKSEFEELFAITKEVSRILTGLRIAIRQRDANNRSPH